MKKYTEMRTLYLDKWDNYPLDHPERIKTINEVIETVEEYGQLRISFDYDGRTRHVSASQVMKNMLIAMGKDYDYEIGYEHYLFIITKPERDV